MAAILVFEIGAAQLCSVKEIAPKTAFFMCEQTPDPVWFSCRLKSYLLYAYVESINGEFWV